MCLFLLFISVFVFVSANSLLFSFSRGLCLIVLLCMSVSLSLHCYCHLLLSVGAFLLKRPMSGRVHAYVEVTTIATITKITTIPFVVVHNSVNAVFNENSSSTVVTTRQISHVCYSNRGKRKSGRALLPLPHLALLN